MDVLTEMELDVEHSDPHARRYRGFDGLIDAQERPILYSTGGISHMCRDEQLSTERTRAFLVGGGLMSGDIILADRSTSLHFVHLPASANVGEILERLRNPIYGTPVFDDRCILRTTASVVEAHTRDNGEVYYSEVGKDYEYGDFTGNRENHLLEVSRSALFNGKLLEECTRQLPRGQTNHESYGVYVPVNNVLSDLRGEIRKDEGYVSLRTVFGKDSETSCSLRIDASLEDCYWAQENLVPALQIILGAEGVQRAITELHCLRKHKLFPFNPYYGPEKPTDFQRESRDKIRRLGESFYAEEYKGPLEEAAKELGGNEQVVKALSIV